MDTDILAKLQRHGGYQGWRVRPYPLNTTLWLAETYTPLGRGNRKGWRALRDAKRGDYRTFPTLNRHTVLYSLCKRNLRTWRASLTRNE